MAQITYADKETLIDRTGVAAINKGRAQDWNEIKSVVNENEGSGSVTPQTYEAVVSFDGNDSTGVVGGLPFLTPTAAAVALRAASGTLMTIKAGTYVAEDLLFADGIISCHDGVTLKTGNNNAMFENIDGSYDGIDFQIVGGGSLGFLGSKSVFNIISPLYALDINLKSIIGQINIDTENFSLIISDKILFLYESIINCRQSTISINFVSSLGSVPEIILDSGSLRTHIGLLEGGIKIGGVGSGDITTTINYFKGGQIHLSHIGISNNTHTLIINSSGDNDDCSVLIGANPTFSERFFISGVFGNEFTREPLTIEDDNQIVTLKNLQLITDNTPCIITTGLNNVDVLVSGSLTMVTTASPKVNANITINDIQDY